MVPFFNPYFLRIFKLKNLLQFWFRVNNSLTNEQFLEHHVPVVLCIFLDFRRRFVSLLSFDCFRVYRPALALDLLYRAQIKEKIQRKFRSYLISLLYLFISKQVE